MTDGGDYNTLFAFKKTVGMKDNEALRTHVKSLGKPRDVNKRSQTLAW